MSKSLIKKFDPKDYIYPHTPSPCDVFYREELKLCEQESAGKYYSTFGRTQDQVLIVSGLFLWIVITVFVFLRVVEFGYSVIKIARALPKKEDEAENDPE